MRQRRRGSFDRNAIADSCWTASGTWACFFPAGLVFGLFHQGASGQTIRFDLEIADFEGIFDQNGFPDSLGAPTYFWRPDQVNYDKRHTQTAGITPDELLCLCADAEMKIDHFRGSRMTCDCLYRIAARRACVLREPAGAFTRDCNYLTLPHSGQHNP